MSSVASFFNRGGAGAFRVRRRGARPLGWRAGTALLGVLCLLAGAAVVFADAAAETLEEALVAAYNNNPTLLAQRAALRATDEGVPQALSGWRPTVSVDADVGAQSIESESRAGLGADETLTPKRLTLSLVQPLYRGGRTGASVRRAENLVLADRARLAEVEQDVLLETVTAYMEVLRARAVLELAINNEQRLRRQLEASQERFAVGEVTRTDVAQAEARVSNAIADRVRAQSDLVTARAAYLNVVGALSGALTPPQPVADLPESERGARTVAVAEHPAILRSVYSGRAARDDVRIARGALLPELSVRGSYATAEDTSTFITTQDTATLRAELAVPLYQSGAEYAEVRAAREVAAQRRLEIEQSRRSVLENVTQWWQALQTARAQIDAFSDAVRAAEIALEGVEQEAAVGARTTLDVLDAEQELFDAQVDLVLAQRDEIVASYGLAAAVGRLTAQAIGLPVDIYDERRHYEAVRRKAWGFGDGTDD